MSLTNMFLCLITATAVITLSTGYLRQSQSQSQSHSQSQSQSNFQSDSHSQLSNRWTSASANGQGLNLSSQTPSVQTLSAGTDARFQCVINTTEATVDWVFATGQNQFQISYPLNSQSLPANKFNLNQDDAAGVRRSTLFVHHLTLSEASYSQATCSARMGVASVSLQFALRGSMVRTGDGPAMVEEEENPSDGGDNPPPPVGGGQAGELPVPEEDNSGAEAIGNRSPAAVCFVVMVQFAFLRLAPLFG